MRVKWQSDLVIHLRINGGIILALTFEPNFTSAIFLHDETSSTKIKKNVKATAVIPNAFNLNMDASEGHAL